MAHAGGRPTSYSEDLLVRAREYLDICEDDEVQQTIGMSAKGTELFKNKIIVKIPTKGGLARYLKVSRDSLYEWSKEYPKFSDIMEELGAKQEEALINKGLSGDYNPTIAKVLLTKHGYKDALDTDITTKGDKIEINPINSEIAQKYEQELKKNL